MVSRDTRAHLGSLAVALLVVVVADWLAVRDGTALVAVGLLCYALVLGGSHLYLAVRGVEGSVPVAARWRYLAMLTVLFAGAAVSTLDGARTVAGVELRTAGIAVAATALGASLVVEGRAAYRDSLGAR